ncbi:uncharacterized protein I206_106976 [Kwoniella pini CBS 10737]|uniref:Uncharacterized protein n=1 Tax=Kwoniella pini CBS 10737 TaxID=1296096 RepID=A0A1B9HZP5_9TREE|nr:uncharacterized protein I206_05481 [Kwoniella pini CBS 10737]OCF48701.1 hypothetical protein I206_05481 [Kwoniella pini CBS 10737]
MIAFWSLLLIPLFAYAAPLVKKVDQVAFTGYRPEYYVEIAGYNIGWTGGSGNYTFTGILSYPGQNITNETVIFDNKAIKSYIYHFADINSYPFNSSFQFRIEDAADFSLFAESPTLPIVSKEEAYGTTSATADSPAQTE